MPIPVLPFAIPLTAMLIAYIATKQSYSKRLFVSLASFMIALLFPLIVDWIVGLSLRSSAQSRLGDHAFQYSKWIENRPDRLGMWTLIPVEHDFEESWYWLSMAASSGHLEAKFAMGIRIKYDIFVPTRHSGSGQDMIDSAIAHGYTPVFQDERYYWREYRK